jgi:hypothetical protein
MHGAHEHAHARAVTAELDQREVVAIHAQAQCQVGLAQPRFVRSLRITGPNA